MDPFPRLQTAKPEDESKVLRDETDQDRYRVDRDGDHLMGSPLSATCATSGI